MLKECLTYGLVALLLCSCASISETECRTTNWYARGEADALMGTRPQIDLYAQQCARFGVRPAEQDYMAGWNVGYGEWNRRVSRGRS